MELHHPPKQVIASDVYLVSLVNSYPKYPFADSGDFVEALRSMFRLWGKDPENPFEEWLSPHGRVVIKPNWVHHTNSNGNDLNSLVTHSSLIHYVIEFAVRALRRKGTIIVGDAPIQGCDFPRLCERSRINDVIESARVRHPGVNFQLKDWRLTLLGDQNGRLNPLKTPSQKILDENNSALQEGYRVADLGRASFLDDIAEYSDRFRVTCYKPSLMSSHHTRGRHEYLVTKDVFGADLLINLPKMKTHKKAGVTGALKNLVGINGHKEYLPHHILGSYFEGGDGHARNNRFRRLYDEMYDSVWERYANASSAKRWFQMTLLNALWNVSRVSGGDHISAGSWSGNETIWRMTLDLNHLLYFSEDSPKQIISIVDGVIAGEGDGPLNPTPKHAHVLVGGENPAYIDAVLGRMMGYNVHRVPLIQNAIYHRKSKFAGPFLEDFSVVTHDGDTSFTVPFQGLPNLRFTVPPHWERTVLSREPHTYADQQE